MMYGSTPLNFRWTIPLSPHLRNSAISPMLWTIKSIAELRTIKKCCGTAIADLQNLTSATPQLSAVSCQFRYFLVPFQDDFKSQS
jgi:hypothetical protein